jgi:hypothetical protein
MRIRSRDQRTKQGGGEPFQVDRRRGQVGLDLHVGETAANRPSETVPGFRLTMESFGAPAVTPMKAPVVIRPPVAAATGPEQRRMVVADDDGLVDPSRRQTKTAHRTTCTVAGTGIEEPSMLGRPLRSQCPALRTFNNVVPGIVAEAAQWHRAPDRLGLGRDQRLDPAPFEGVVDLP